MSMTTLERTEVETEFVAVALLKPHPNNPREHPPTQIEMLKESLQRFGQVKPVVVQKVGGVYRLYGGHGVTEAARGLRWKELEAKVLPASWSEEQCAGYMLADNASGKDDDGRLLILWQEQLDNGFSLESVGTTLETFEAIRAEFDVPIKEEKEKRPTLVDNAKEKKQIRSVVSVDQIDLIEQAIRKTGLMNRGAALEAICKAYLTGGVEDFDA